MPHKSDSERAALEGNLSPQRQAAIAAAPLFAQHPAAPQFQLTCLARRKVVSKNQQQKRAAFLFPLSQQSGPRLAGAQVPAVAFLLLI